MKIVVIGGTGLIGSKVVKLLGQQGHEVGAASPRNGVNALTGEGLDQAMKGAEVVIDVANSPSFEDNAVLEFFEKSSRNILAAESAAGVNHHVALSVVGTDRLQGSGYFRAKLAQEKLIAASGVPFTIVRATQFLEFLGGIADFSTQDKVVRLSSAQLQPIAADDVAEAIAKAALSVPTNGISDIAGPENAGLAEFVKRYLAAVNDPRTVVEDAAAPYFGLPLEKTSLVPTGNAWLGSISLDAWLATR